MLHNRMQEMVVTERKSLTKSRGRSVSNALRAVLDNPLKGAARSIGVWAAPLSIWLFMASSGASAQYEAYKWSYKKTRDGVQLFTSDAPRHVYDAVQSTVTIDVRPETVISILREIHAYPRWYARCSQTRILERPPAQLPIKLAPDGKFIPTGKAESYTLYFLQDVPVVADRWAIIRNKIRFARDGSLVIEFGSLNKYKYKAPDGTVRMYVFGYWLLTPLSPTRMRISFMMDIDPVLSVPDFMVDPVLHDIAIDTIAGLRKMVKSRR